MKKIELTKGKFAVVDDQDFEWLNQWKWQYDGNYASRWKMVKRVKSKIYLHRLIMNFPKGLVDHKNQDKLDNRRKNLRLCNKSQQMFNTGLRKTNTSGIKGIRWDKDRKKWLSQITINYKHIFLGRFNKKEEAILAYQYAIKEYAKEFAYI